MRHLLPLLPRPARYLGNEAGVQPRPDAAVRLALAFPDLYEVGMSYTGMHLLLAAVNADPAFAAERVFAPDEAAGQVLRQAGVPLATLETGTPLADCDVVGFHCTHELCATTILWMLDLAGLPRRAADRPQDLPAGPLSRGLGGPLVIAGGGMTPNAEPLAPFFDCLVLGDGEVVLPAILRRVRQARDAGLSRRELLEDLALLPGLYVPALPQARVERVMVPDLDAQPYPLHGPQAYGAVHDRFTIEIARGCTRGCRFCHAGMVYRPVRERGLDSLEAIVDQGVTASGYEELSFLSLSTGDFSALAGLFARTIPRCRAEQVSISLPSLRVGSVSPAIMGQIAGLRRTGVTLAPEAGSQRLRDVINKGVTEAGLLEHVTALFQQGWDQVKLYFMIGLPTETREDLEAILDLCRKVEAAGRQVKGKPGRLQVTAGVSTFVPKPHTPFQWERQISLEETRERLGLLKSLFRPHKRLALRFHQPEMSWLEGVFSRGDRRLAQAIERAADLGARFDSWSDHLDLDRWRQAFADTGVDPDSCLAARDPAAPLPWDHLHPGVRKGFLLAERRRALAGKRTEDCRHGDCYRCGACPDGPAHILNQSRRDQETAPTPSRTGESIADDASPARQALGDKAQQVRLWYAKTGLAAWLSQRELGQVFERAFRRARLPLSFSQGFHPLPRMSFGRALPVGVESEAECLDVVLRQRLAPEAIADSLRHRLPGGMDLLGVEALPDPAVPGGPAPTLPPLDRGTEDYLLTLDDARPDLASLALARLREFAALATLPAEIPGKKGTRAVDLRPFLAALAPREDGSLLLTLDWREGYLNPLTLLRRVLEGPEGEAFPLESARLRKLAPAPPPWLQGDPAAS